MKRSTEREMAAWGRVGGGRSFAFGDRANVAFFFAETQRLSMEVI